MATGRLSRIKADLRTRDDAAGAGIAADNDDVPIEGPVGANTPRERDAAAPFKEDGIVLGAAEYVPPATTGRDTFVGYVQRASQALDRTIAEIVARSKVRDNRQDAVVSAVVTPESAASARKGNPLGYHAAVERIQAFLCQALGRKGYFCRKGAVVAILAWLCGRVVPLRCRHHRQSIRR